MRTCRRRVPEAVPRVVRCRGVARYRARERGAAPTPLRPRRHRSGWACARASLPSAARCATRAPSAARDRGRTTGAASPGRTRSRRPSRSSRRGATGLRKRRARSRPHPPARSGRSGEREGSAAWWSGSGLRSLCTFGVAAPHGVACVRRERDDEVRSPLTDAPDCGTFRPAPLLAHGQRSLKGEGVAAKQRFRGRRTSSRVRRPLHRRRQAL